MFLDNKRFGLTDSVFINDYHIAYAYMYSILTPLGRTPSDANSIDLQKHISIIKLYEESNERNRLAYGLLNNSKNHFVFDYINRTFNKLESHYFSYGYNEKYGYVDTTGTASGYITNKVVIKGIAELIEKNEMALFWYLKKGYYIEKDIFISTLIQKQKFISNQVEIFECKNISSMSTYIVMLFENNNYVASGASSNLNSDTALLSALNEAKLLEWQNYKNYKSPISNYNKEKIYDYFLALKVNSKYYMSNIHQDLLFNNTIKSLDIAILNSTDPIKSVTIKCCSKDLLACLPLKQNIVLNSSMFSQKLQSEDFDIIPDCILL
jgi:hypothetical protein